jgi:hypothetical protein
VKTEVVSSLEAPAEPFVPWGFNYDHDRQGRLLEDYWIERWDDVVEDFREMRQLGANTVRIHLQLGRFLDSPQAVSATQIQQLRKLVQLAEAEQLRLNVTGLGCYHKAAIPTWYDGLTEQQRWEVQGFFWKSIALACRESPAIFCYDLMNEPVSPAGVRPGMTGWDRRSGTSTSCSTWRSTPPGGREPRLLGAGSNP